VVVDPVGATVGAWNVAGSVKANPVRRAARTSERHLYRSPGDVRALGDGECRQRRAAAALDVTDAAVADHIDD